MEAQQTGTVASKVDPNNKKKNKGKDEIEDSDEDNEDSDVGGEYDDAQNSGTAMNSKKKAGQ